MKILTNIMSWIKARLPKQTVVTIDNIYVVKGADTPGAYNYRIDTLCSKLGKIVETYSIMSLNSGTHKIYVRVKSGRVKEVNSLVSKLAKAGE